MYACRNRHPNHIHHFSQRVSIHGSRGQRNVRGHRFLTNLIILLSSPSHMHPRNTHRSARGITSDVAMRIRSNAILAYGIIAVQLSARWRRPPLPHPDPQPASLVAQLHRGTVSRRRGTFFEATCSMGNPSSWACPLMIVRGSTPPRGRYFASSRLLKLKA